MHATYWRSAHGTVGPGYGRPRAQISTERAARGRSRRGLSARWSQVRTSLPEAGGDHLGSLCRGPEHVVRQPGRQSAAPRNGVTTGHLVGGVGLLDQGYGDVFVEVGDQLIAALLVEASRLARHGGQVAPHQRMLCGLDAKSASMRWSGITGSTLASECSNTCVRWAGGVTSASWPASTRAQRTGSMARACPWEPVTVARTRMSWPSVCRRSDREPGESTAPGVGETPFAAVGGTPGG